MATRSIIAKRTTYGWEGRYHHWDGYPTGLGAGLVEHVHKYGVEFVIKKLIDEEPVGWSTVIGRDLTAPPAWEGIKDDVGNAPVSYFSRGEEPRPPMRHDDTEFTDAEYCYVIDPWQQVMTVLKRPYGDDKWHRIGDVSLASDWESTWRALQVLDTVEVHVA